MDTPLVSIVIPCFNREQYIAATIESCLQQTYKNIEIIVVDDGSTDNSLNIIKEYASVDSRLKIFHTVNQGPCVARNIGLGISEGLYIKFLDSDDVLLLYTIEYQVQSLIYYQADITIGKIILFWDQEITDIKNKVPEILNFSASDLVIKEPYINFVKRGEITFNEILIKRDIVYQCQGFNPWLGGANESSLNAKILILFPEIKAVFHSDTVLLLKRIGYYSLAATNRMSKKTPPWALISYQKSGEYAINQLDSINLEVKQFIFEEMYMQMIYAYRKGFAGYALTAFNIWKQGNIKHPILNPWYHNLLHEFLGFVYAENILFFARNVMNSLRNLFKEQEKKSV